MTAKNPRLVILDSHAIIHRAYHALPDFSSSKGEPTGALYGLVSMLLKIVADLKPDYIVACRDLPGPTERHTLFEDYKGTRAKTEDELVAQLIRAPEIFKAFGIPVYEAPAFEADDCIGTIVHQLQKRPVDIVIASGDLDTLQLVSGKKVQVYTLRQGLNDTILYDEDRVRERFGFGPEHMTDYKALRGDPSDNIKGIKGIGEKSATDLILAFGSIEEMYKDIAKSEDVLEKAGIKKRARELVVAGEKDARMSKTLATIRTDAPINFSLPEKKWSISDVRESVSTLCDELEFRSLKDRINGVKERVSTVQEDASEDTLDPDELREACVALSLVRSDLTNPTLEDILQFTETKKFSEARTILFSKLKNTGALMSVYETIEKPLIPIVARMQKDGILLDQTYLASLAKEYNKELGRIAGEIFLTVGHEFNLNSPKQLAVVLYDELKLGNGRLKKTAGGARTTREEELLKLAELHPIIRNILGFRELQKLLSTYVEKMPEAVGEDGRIHAEFLQMGAATGRMASINPNLQNIPIKTEYGRRIRRAFVAKKGSVLVALDYSQIELRIAAALSGDKNLIDVFAQGGDIHTAVASRVFSVPPEKVDREMRRRAKVINFGILYGMGVNALRTSLGEGVGREEAAKFLSDYFENYKGLAQYIEHTKAEAARLGYTETLFGRRRYFPQFKSALPNLRAQAERMAINAPIQGTQADIIKLAMIEVDRVIEKNGWRDSAHLLLQVHDELVYEIEEGKAHDVAREIKRIMESVVTKEKIGVPIVAEVKMGKNWEEMEKSE